MPSLHVEIEFCMHCKFMPRAVWLAAELLQERQDHIAELRLIPSSGGRFFVRIDGAEVFSRAEAGRFPEPKDLIALVDERIE